jgi:two-component system nitrate/nitrite response regulator NarL
MIRVFILSDVRLYREGLAHFLGESSGFEIVGTSGHGGSILGTIMELRPDVALLDLTVADGVAAARDLRRAAPELPVVALAVRELEREILAWAEAGIAGYVTRDGSLDDLVSTIETVARGEAVCSPRVVATLLRRLASLAAERPLAPREVELTLRELQIVELIDDGLSNKEIARQLSIELPTVKNHVHHILRKLQVSRRGEAAASLRRWRLSELPTTRS